MRLVALASVSLLLGCGTIADSLGGGDALPSAEIGPFRAIEATELGNFRTAPNALEDTNNLPRDGSVVDLDGDPDTLEVAGYFASNPAMNGVTPNPGDPPTAIERFGALDGRSFDASNEVVLQPKLAWEGGTVGAPHAIRVGKQIWLYYAAKGGIGLAQGDGHAFTRQGSPVLAASTSGWDRGAVPTSPGVVALASGGFRMFYEARLASGPAIGEASSTDGVKWTRVGAVPVLAPSGSDYDAAGVGAPFPVLSTSALGRAETLVYYAATDATGLSTIGLAGRYGDDGPLTHAVSPVYGTAPFAPTEPCVVVFTDFTLLFATEAATSTSATPATAAGVAPATITLPPPVSQP